MTSLKTEYLKLLELLNIGESRIKILPNMNLVAIKELYIYDTKITVLELDTCAKLEILNA